MHKHYFIPSVVTSEKLKTLVAHKFITSIHMFLPDYSI
jgi:hypothetical protein